nr:zinc finger, CCHC-type [Tanacetum cinerariifolium]
MDLQKKAEGLTVSQLEYSRVIGCLMYDITCTRPDIAFAVGKSSRYTSNLGTQHWQAIQRVVEYLKKTMNYRLVYSGYPSVVRGYTDASWISNTEDNLSTSGWVFLLGGGEISWAFKKQTCITGSTMKSEFVALTATAPIFFRCDSAATLAKAYIHMYNEKSRHLGVRHNMIRELITNGVAEAHVLQIIPRMFLEPVGKKDEVVNFSMVNFFEKVLSGSMNKDEPPMLVVSYEVQRVHSLNAIHQWSLVIFIRGFMASAFIELSVGMLLSGLADASGN